MSKQTEALKLALGYMDGTLMTEHLTGYERKRHVMQSIREALTEQPAQQQEPVQTTPNFAQLKQILDNLDRCHHMDSKQEFLRTWIRDWTEHKLAKHIQPASKPWVGLTRDEIIDIINRFAGEDWVYAVDAIEAKLKEKNA